MISNFEFYESNLQQAIEQYNSAIKRSSVRNAQFIFSQIIVPAGIDYRKALWEGRYLEPKDIYRFGLVKSSSVIYLAMGRKINILKTFD